MRSLFLFKWSHRPSQSCSISNLERGVCFEHIVQSHHHTRLSNFRIFIENLAMYHLNVGIQSRWVEWPPKTHMYLTQNCQEISPMVWSDGCKLWVWTNSHKLSIQTILPTNRSWQTCQFPCGIWDSNWGSVQGLLNDDVLKTGKTHRECPTVQICCLTLCQQFYFIWDFIKQACRSHFI